MPMRRHSLRWMAALLTTPIATPTLAQPDADGFEWALITDVGNEPYMGNPNSPVFGRGRVDYEYRISVYEITTAQWVEFVNTFSTQSDNLTFFGMPSSWGAAVDSDYEGPGRRWVVPPVANADLFPVKGLTWYECAQYANWLHNGKSADLTALDTGAYDASTWGPDKVPGSFSDAPNRMPGARYWLPNLDEWVKAAHYDPNRHGVGIGGWWVYPNTTDKPLVSGPPGIGQTAAGMPCCYFDEDMNILRTCEIPLRSYPERSPWGLYDVSGGALEWLENYFRPEEQSDRIFAGSVAGGGTEFYITQDRVDVISSTGPNGSAGLRLATSRFHACRVDLASPFGELDIDDVLVFIGLIVNDDLRADLAPPFGDLDYTDVIEYITRFGGGCL